jgi:hypothetical protein
MQQLTSAMQQLREEMAQETGLSGTHPGLTCSGLARFMGSVAEWWAQCGGQVNLGRGVGGGVTVLLHSPRRSPRDPLARPLPPTAENDLVRMKAQAAIDHDSQLAALRRRLEDEKRDKIREVAAEIEAKKHSGVRETL